MHTGILQCCLSNKLNISKQTENYSSGFPMTIPWVQVHAPQPAPAALTQTLSPTQEKIRQRILAERQNNRNRISQILKMEMVKDIMMMDAEDILEMDAGVLFSGNEEEFVFDTLPIV